MVTAITSCIQISGLTSGFSHLTKQQQERVVAYKGRIADIHDYSYVYAVAVEQVKELCDRAMWIDAGEIRMCGDVETVCDEYCKEMMI